MTVLKLKLIREVLIFLCVSSVNLCGEASIPLSPSPEKRGPNPDQGRALADGRFEIP
jgi:hypothetical protein